MFLRHRVLPLKIVTVRVKYFSLALDVSLMPISLYSGSISEEHGAKSIFPAIKKATLINGSIIVVIFSIAIFFPLVPHPLVLVLIGIVHVAIPLFNIIPPFSLINITIGIPVPSPPLFAILNIPFIRFPILEDVGSIDEDVLTPGSIVDIPRRVEVEPKA